MNMRVIYVMRIAVPILLAGGGGPADHNVLAYCRIRICSGGGGYTLCGSAGLARSLLSRLGNIRPKGTEAIEIDVDAVRDLNGDVFIAGIMQHIEEAGVHSGDSACAIPTYSISNSQIQLIVVF